jgi:hypothetical protein
MAFHIKNGQKQGLNHAKWHPALAKTRIAVFLVKSVRRKIRCEKERKMYQKREKKPGRGIEPLYAALCRPKRKGRLQAAA